MEPAQPGDHLSDEPLDEVGGVGVRVRGAEGQHAEPDRRRRAVRGDALHRPHEAVPAAGNRLDVRLAVLAEGAPQPVHAAREARVGHRHVGPHGAPELVPGDHAPVVPHEEQQRLELLGAEARSRVAPEERRGALEPPRADLEDLRVHRSPPRSAPGAQAAGRLLRF